MDRLLPCNDDDVGRGGRLDRDRSFGFRASRYEIADSCSS